MNNPILFYFAARVGNGILAILTLTVLTRMLSPSEYGEYALYLAIATAFSSLCFQWLVVSISRFYPIYIDDQKKLFVVVSRYYWVAVLTALIISIGTLHFNKLLGIEPIKIGFLFLITIALGRYNIALQISNSQYSHIRYCMISWAKISASLLAAVFFIRLGCGSLGALIGFFVGLVFSICFFEPKPRIGHPFKTTDIQLSNDLMRYGLPLTINFIAIILVDLADRFIIANIMGYKKVAIYAVGYDLVQLIIGPLMSVFFTASFPIILKLFHDGERFAANQFLRHLAAKLICIGVPVVVGLSTLSEDISQIFLGIEYQKEAAAIMPFLAVAIFLGSFKNYCFDVVFQLNHETKLQCYIAVLMAAVNIVLNLIFMPSCGLIAAVWATLAAFFIGALASWIVAKKMFFSLDLTSFFWRVILASLIMGAALNFIPAATGISMLATKVMVASFIYLGLGLMLNIFQGKKNQITSIKINFK